MLRIIQNRSSASAQTYYTQGDYYSEGQELAGHWGGKGAKRLGLTGEIRQEDFQALCENKNPRTGERLSPRNKDDRTVGYDFNFHVPKNVSVTYLLNRDERILEAFHNSVRETMEEIETDARTRVRTRGRDEARATGNLVWGQFVHLTARPVNGVPDPHLHAHCFVFNQTFDDKEKRWKAGQFRDIKRDAPYFEAAFYARFAKRLQDLGYPIRRRGKKWDLTHVPPSLTKKFSRRTDQIEKLAAKESVTDAKKKEKLGAKTRERKEQDLSMTELRALWRERLSDEERASLQRVGQGSPSPERRTQQQSIEHALRHCFERNSVIAKRQLLTEAMMYGIGDVLPEQAHDQLARDNVLVRAWEGRELTTTREVLAEEQRMLAYAREGRGKCSPLSANWQIRQQKLNAGQRGAVQHVTSSGDRVMVIKGMAGTGKTTLMQEAVQAIESAGHQVFTFAPSAEASRNVLRKEGFSNATTVAELLLNKRLQEAAKGQVLWIDEAGLLGTRDMARVFDIAETINARVILSGDWRQHGSVTRGVAMRLLEHEGGIRPALVRDIQRQRGAYRETVALLARGDTDSGFEQLDSLGWIRELNDEDRPQAIAREYAESLEKDGESPLVVSPTHKEGDQITHAIREELKNRKLLGDDETTLKKLTSLNLTEAERADSAMYEKDDVIVFQQNAPGYRKGQRVVVGEVMPSELLVYADRFQVYRESDLAIATGDVLRFTSNSMTKDGKHRLNNGAMYRVTGFDESGDLRLANGWIVARDHGFLTSGYTVTSHASQGKTVGKVIIAESTQSLRAASREQFYVSVSRGRHQAVVFTDSKAALREAIGKSDPRLGASELVYGMAPNPQLIQQRAIQGRQLVTRQPPPTQSMEREAHGQRR